MSDGERPPAPGRDTTPEGAPPQGDPPLGQPPLAQRLYDSPFLLLVASTVIMGLFFTAWGLWEILTLPGSDLP